MRQSTLEWASFVQAYVTGYFDITSKDIIKTLYIGQTKHSIKDCYTENMGEKGQVYNWLIDYSCTQ